MNRRKYRVNISRTVVEHSAITIDLDDNPDLEAHAASDERFEAARVWISENIGLPIFEPTSRSKESQWEIESMTKVEPRITRLIRCSHIDIHWRPRKSDPGYDVYAVSDDAQTFLQKRKSKLFNPETLRELVTLRRTFPDRYEVRYPTSDGLQDVSDYQLNEIADVNEKGTWVQA